MDDVDVRWITVDAAALITYMATARWNYESSASKTLCASVYVGVGESLASGLPPTDAELEPVWDDRSHQFWSYSSCRWIQSWGPSSSSRPCGARSRIL